MQLAEDSFRSSLGQARGAKHPVFVYQHIPVEGDKLSGNHAIWQWVKCPMRRFYPVAIQCLHAFVIPQIDQTLVNGVFDQIDPAMQIQLAHNVFAVTVNGLGANHQLLCDGCVG